MKVILNQDVPNLGEEGDVCVVKDGYARNYLLPTGAAVVYNNASVAIFKSRAAAIEKRKIEKRQASADLKSKLDEVSITIKVATGESGKLFGSVTTAMVQAELAKLGFDIEKKRIEVPVHSIKMVGTYSARIRLYENASSEIKIVVKGEGEEEAEEVKAEEVKTEEVKAEEVKAEEAPVAEN